MFEIQGYNKINIYRINNFVRLTRHKINRDSQFITPYWLVKPFENSMTPFTPVVFLFS